LQGIIGTGNDEKRTSGAVRVSHQQRTVKASTFRAWYELLEATVAHDPDEVAIGDSQSAVRLLHALVDIGIRNGAILPLVTHSSGPIGFAHLSFRYLLNQEFDWSGEIALTPEPGHDTTRLQQLIWDLDAATGITPRDDEIGDESI
jgi:hypothetical protein